MRKNLIRTISLCLFLIMAISSLPLSYVFAAGYNPSTDSNLLEEINFNDYAALSDTTGQFLNSGTYANAGALSTYFTDTTENGNPEARRIAPKDKSANVRLIYDASESTYDLYELTESGWTYIARRKMKTGTFTPWLNFRTWVTANQDFDYFMNVKDVVYKTENGDIKLNFNEVACTLDEITESNVTKSEDGYEVTVVYSDSVGNKDFNFGVNLTGVIDKEKDYTLEFYYQCSERSGIHFMHHTEYGYKIGFGVSFAVAEDAVSEDGKALVLSGTDGFSTYMIGGPTQYSLYNNTYTLAFDIETTDIRNDALRAFFLYGDGAGTGSAATATSANTNTVSRFGFATMTDTSFAEDGKAGGANPVYTLRNLEWARWKRAGDDSYSSPYIMGARNRCPIRIADPENHYRQSFKVVFTPAGSQKTTMSVYALCAETESYLLCGSTVVKLFSDGFRIGIMTESELSEGQHVSLQNVKIYEGNTAGAANSTYANAVNGQLLYDVNFSGFDGVTQYYSNPWARSSDYYRAINADSYRLNPYTGVSDSALVIKRDVLISAKAAEKDAANGMDSYYDTDPKSESTKNNVHMVQFPDYKVKGNVYTLSFWAEHVNKDTSNYFDAAFYFAEDGVKHAFTLSSGESDYNVLRWKYNDGDEVFITKTVTTTTTDSSTGKTTTTTADPVVEFGTWSSYTSVEGQTVTSSPSTSGTVTTTTSTAYSLRYTSYLSAPTGVNRAVDKENGNRQYFKVIIDGVNNVMSVYALSIKGHYEFCGEKKLNSSGITADTPLMLGMYTYEAPSPGDYMAMGGVKVFKGDVTDAPLTTEENKFFDSAMGGEVTLDNGESWKEANRLYNVDFRQGIGTAYGVKQGNKEGDSYYYYNTLANSAGYIWGMGGNGTNADMSSYGADFVTGLAQDHPINHVKSILDDGLGIRFERTVSGAWGIGSYMPYKNNWQFGDYAITLNARGNAVLGISVLQSGEHIAGFRTHRSGNNDTVAVDKYNFGSTYNANVYNDYDAYTKADYHGGKLKFYDFTNQNDIDLNDESIPQGIRNLKGKYQRIYKIEEFLYQPADGSANIKIEFKNSENLIHYYALTDTSTDANVEALEWVPYGTIQYFDEYEYKAIFGISGWTYNPVESSKYQSGTDDNGNPKYAYSEYSDWMEIRNVRVEGKSFYSKYNSCEDGDTMFTVDFKKANNLGFDANNVPIANSNKSGFLWNTYSNLVTQDRINGVTPLDKDNNGFFETLYINPSISKMTFADAEHPIKNGWKYESFTLEMAVNSDEPTIIGALRCAPTSNSYPFGFSLSGNNPSSYDKITKTGDVSGSNNVGYFHNARFARGASFLYQNGINSGGTTGEQSNITTAGVTFKSYYYSDGYTSTEAAKTAESGYRNLYPTRVDTRETGAKNVKIEYNNTLHQITLYELCYNDTDLTDAKVDTTNGISWHKIATVDFSGSFEKNVAYVEPTLFFYAFEVNAEAYFSNVDITRGLTANYNSVYGFEDLNIGDEFLTLENPLGTNFVKEESTNTYGENLPFDLVNFDSYTVEMLVNSPDAMQSVSVLKLGGSKYAYSSVGFTLDKNGVSSVSPSFVVDDRTVSESNTSLPNLRGIELEIHENTTPRYYADGLDANVKIEFDANNRTVTLYELCDIDDSAKVNLRFVRVAEISYSDHLDYMAIFEGTAAFENVRFIKGLTGDSLGVRETQFTPAVAPDDVPNATVDIRLVSTVESENYYFVGVQAYMVRKGDKGIETSKTLTKTATTVGKSISTGNGRFSEISAEKLGGQLAYTVTVSGVPTTSVEWVELHVTPFILTQQFDGQGEFVYDDTTTAEQIITQWKGDKEQGIEADATLGSEGSEKVILVENGVEAEKSAADNERNNNNMVERSIGADGATTDLRVMSSNVYGHTLYKNEYRATLLANAVKTYAPDIVGFNEVWSWAFPQCGTLESVHEPTHYETLKRELEDTGKYVFLDWSSKTNEGYYVGENTTDYVDSYSDIGANVETCLKTTVDTNCHANCTCREVASEVPLQIAIRAAYENNIVDFGWRYQSQATGNASGQYVYQDPYEHLHGIGWVALEIDGQKILYVDGHLNRSYTEKDSNGKAAYTTFRTEDLYAAVKDALDKQGWNEADTAIIMGGDMWTGTSSSYAPAYNYLVEQGFSNAQHNAEQIWTFNQGTSHSCSKNSNAGRCRYCGYRADAGNNSCANHNTVFGSSELGNADIDLLLYKNAYAIGSTTLSRTATIEISDHMPLVADFSFKKAQN